MQGVWLFACVVTFHPSSEPTNTALAATAQAPPTMDDLWDHGNATFKEILSFPMNDPRLPGVDAGTRVVVVNATWYLFGRHDTGPTPTCSSGMISINVRASVDQGRTWTLPHSIIEPDETAGTCTCKSVALCFPPRYIYCLSLFLALVDTSMCMCVDWVACLVDIYTRRHLRRRICIFRCGGTHVALFMPGASSEWCRRLANVAFHQQQRRPAD